MMQLELAGWRLLLLVGFSIDGLDNHGVVERLERAGCGRIVLAKASTRHGLLLATVRYLSPGDTLVVFQLPDLGHPLHSLVELLLSMAAEGKSVMSLREEFDTRAESSVVSTLAKLVKFTEDIAVEA